MTVMRSDCLRSKPEERTLQIHKNVKSAGLPQTQQNKHAPTLMYVSIGVSNNSYFPSKQFMLVERCLVKTFGGKQISSNLSASLHSIPHLWSVDMDHG